MPGAREYTNDELWQMQLDAIKRARDMQQRANDALRGSNPERTAEPRRSAEPKYESARTARSEPDTRQSRDAPRRTSLPINDRLPGRAPSGGARRFERPAERPPEKPPQSAPAPERERSNPLAGLRGMLKSLTGGLTGDGDRVLLIGLLLLLGSEGADELLLMALLYIMM